MVFKRRPSEGALRSLPSSVRRRVEASLTRSGLGRSTPVGITKRTPTDPTGGTIIVVDPKAKKTAIVNPTTGIIRQGGRVFKADSPTKLRAAIERGRQATIKARTQTTPEKKTSGLLASKGFTVGINKAGQTIAKKGNKTVGVSRQGNLVRQLPTGAAVFIQKIQPTKKTIVGRDQKLKRLEKDIRDIGELERKAAKRSEQAADIFRVIPGLRGDNFAQKTARALLAIPARATVGVGEQTIIAGFKLSVTGKARRLNLNVKDEETRSFKRIPLTVVEGYDPRKPEGLANILATVAAFKFAKTQKVSTKNVKSAGTSVIKKLGNTAKRATGKTKLALQKITANTKRAIKSPNKIKAIQNKANKIATQASIKIKAAIKKPITKVKAARAQRTSRKLVAREKVRKILQNQEALKKLQTSLKKTSLKKTSKALKQDKVEPARQRALTKFTKNKIRNIKKTNRQLLKEVVASGFSRAGLLRSLKKTAKKAKPKKVKKVDLSKVKLTKNQARRLRTAAKRAKAKAEELTLAKLIIKGKRKLTPSTPARVRKIVRAFRIKGIKGKKLAPIRKLRGQQKKSKLIRDAQQRAIKDAKEARLQKSDIDKSKVMVNKLKKAKTKKEFDNLRTSIKRLFGNKKGQLLRTKSKLRKANAPASQIKAVTKQIATINNLIISTNNIIARSNFTRQKGRIITTPGKQKQPTKTRSVTKPKTDTPGKPKIEEIAITIPDVRIDQLPKQRQAQIINNIITQVLGTAAILRASGRRTVIPQTRFRGGIGRLRKFIFAKLRPKRFVFTPDIYSIIFGVRARGKERIKLLKPGRFFTGLERRKIV